MPSHARIKLQSSPDLLVRRVVHDLYAGSFAPGQRLIETDIARVFGVSRGTVREAMKRLSSEGIVQLTKHKGPVIRKLTRKEAVDILLVLDANLRLLARLAAEAIDEGGRTRLLRQHRRLMEFRDSSDLIGFVRNSNLYVIILMRIAGNSALKRLLPQMQIPLLRLLFRRFPAGVPQDKRFDDYHEITTAILQGEAHAADEAVHVTVNRFLEVVDLFPDHMFQPE